MFAVAAACLIAALIAWSAVLAARGFGRGGPSVCKLPSAPDPVHADWPIPYKLEATFSPPTLPRLRPVSARMAAVRTLCLAAYIRRAEWETAAEGVGSNVTLTAELPDPHALNVWLRSEGLWPLLGELERRGLDAPAGQWDDALRLYAEGAREALAMLAWAGHFEDQFPGFDTASESAALCAAVGLMLPTAALLHDLSIRPECELAAARELCQAWVWRARIALDQLDSDGSPAPLDVIRSAARYWSVVGAFEMVEYDFPISGQAFAQLDAAACRHIHRVAQLRLHGLNWVCGLTHTWDPTSSRRLSM